MGLLEQQTPAQPADTQMAVGRLPEAQPTPVNRNISPESAPPEAMPGQGASEQGGAEMSVLNKYIKNAVKIIHDPKVSDNIIDTVSKAPDPVDAVGEMSVEVSNRINDSAEQAQVPFDETVMAHGLNVVVGEVAGVVEAAGVAKLSDEQKYQAYSWALSTGIDNMVRSGKLPPEELKSLGKRSAQHITKLQQQQQQQGGAPAPEAGV